MTVSPGLMNGEELDSATATRIIQAFHGGLGISASRMAARPDRLFASDHGAGLVPADEIQRAAAVAVRFPGLRDILVAGHPVVANLAAKLAADVHLIPQPEPEIVAGLSALDGYARDGKVITINGVPTPAGKRQTDYYVVLRWRPLCSPCALPHLIYCRDPREVRPADCAVLGIAVGESPALIHLVNHDSSHVTDETQMSLLMFGTATHRDNLVALQKSNPALFVALWCRDFEKAWKLGRRMLNADLPPSNPKSRIRSRLRRLIYGTALISEFERLFEIIDCLKAVHGVTRDSVKAALLGCSSLTGVALVATKAFVAEGAAHIRALHPTMDTERAADPDRIAAAFSGSTVFRTGKRKLRTVTGGTPVRYFLGVEPGMLAAVALIHMIEEVKKLEVNYRQPGKRGLGTDDRQDTATVELAVLITSNICLPTARSILQREAKLGGSDDGWVKKVVLPFIDNPRLRDEAERLYEQHHGLTAQRSVPILFECDRKRRHSPYAQAQSRAKMCASPVGRPGWTQGFRFEAWLRPDAELRFLRKCCRYVQYDRTQAENRGEYLANYSSDSFGAKADATKTDTDLPQQHPLERIQDLFRRFFDRLQLAELAAERASAHFRAYREALIREIAPLLAAVSPITVDPYLNERMHAAPTAEHQRLARNLMWNT